MKAAFPGLALVCKALIIASCAERSLIQPSDCYELVISPWPASADYGDDTLLLAPPPRVRLDSLRPYGRDTLGMIADLPDVCRASTRMRLGAKRRTIAC